MISIEDRLAAADAHREKGRIDSALMLYQLVLDVNPRNREALKAVAAIYAEQGRFAEALEAIGVVVAVAPEDVDGLTRLASYAEGAGDSARATAALDQIVLLDPDGSSTALLRANRAADLGDLPAAERILVEALRQEPKNTGMIMALSRLYFAGGMIEDAVSLAERAVGLAPEDGTCLSFLASQLVALGDHRGALECYERALLAAPVDLVALVGLVECHASCGELTEAHRLASRAIALRPDLLPAWRAYVRVEILKGEGEAALKRFNEVARSHASRVDALICLADCHRLAGGHAACLKLLGPLAGRSSLTPLQAQMADGLRRESALALGDFETVLATVAGLDILAASLADDEKRPVTVSIPATTTINEVLPLLRLTDLPKVGRPVAWSGLNIFSDIASLAPGVAFTPVDPGQPAPPGLPLPALIGLAGVSAETLAAAIPYVEAPTDRREIWRAALAEFPRPHVALAWNAARPGLMLDDLAPILEGFSGTFIAVVWDEGRHQLKAFPQVIDAGAEITGLADVAAVLAECDFVLGPDCLPLHLAGALGARGLALTQPDANWYWHEREGRSVWYPSIEVVHTRRVGHWAARRDDIIDGVGRRLAALSDGDGANPEDGENAQREVA
ncbi:tetratricopeptide repeat protein [Pseudomonas sp. R2.Fl]|nr:tetratricopeptide repeat protein [Pseudomonas sp. R2.Fl]